MKVTEQLILDYIDGALNEEQAQFVLDQINQDPQLHATYLSFKEANSLLQSIPVVPPSHAFSENVMSAITLESRKKHAPASFKSLMIIPAAMVILTIMILFWQQGTGAEGGSSLSKYISLVDFSQHRPDIANDNPFIATFRNYSYVLILACAMVLLDAFIRRKKVIVSLF